MEAYVVVGVLLIAIVAFVVFIQREVLAPKTHQSITTLPLEQEHVDNVQWKSLAVVPGD
jgi:hypothetical protein